MFSGQRAQGLGLVRMDGDQVGHLHDLEDLHQERIDRTEYHSPAGVAQLTIQGHELAQHGAGHALNAGKIQDKIPPPLLFGQVQQVRADRLDGRPCRYEDVPDGATIILLETATNWSKEIVKIHFQSGGRWSPARSAPAAAGQSRTPNGTVP